MARWVMVQLLVGAKAQMLGWGGCEGAKGQTLGG